MYNKMPLVFSTEEYNYLRIRLLEISSNNIEDGLIEINHFPDGERYIRLISSVADRDVVLIGGTISNDDTLEVFDLASAIVKYGAQSITIMIPYFGYSTMERAIKVGEVVTAKNRAVLLSAIPKSKYGNKVVLFDLHSEGIPHYFENDLQPIHLYCKEIVMEAAKELSNGNEFVLASTDAGRAKWVESLANDLGVVAGFVFKRRTNAIETVVTSVSADVKGKHVIIYDDMIRTGGSLINAAKAYKSFGANRISVITTHGIFVGNVIDKLIETGIIDKVICTDTHPNSLHVDDNKGFVVVKSVAKMMLNFILPNQ
ncbi:MAG: ribose-phosphate pyrophosphokinase [Bacteroidetes bacterium]|nr:ribose-phosphate pyrophosphokinase [Bacteroidota bacterium]MBL0077639.1 ribose-phosphate pyrophosphokinase [Bacteroidota bacterium]